MRAVASAVTLVLLASACGGGSDIAATATTTTASAAATVPPTTTTPTTTTVAPTTTAAPVTTVAPAATQAPTTTAVPTTTVAATTTTAPTTTTTAALTTTVPPTTAGPIPLAWPHDVGVSHFGHISAGRGSGPGGWRRPLKGTFLWGLVEATPGRYLWRRTDSVVAAIQAERIAVLTVLWPFADWDQEACHGDRPKSPDPDKRLGDSLYGPCDSDAYASWVTATVERYDGDGVDDMPGLEYPLRHWEVANEPSMQTPQLANFQGNSADYLELLKITYEAIKSADPSAVVFLGGQAGMRDPTVEFWEPVLEGASGFFDVGNIHSIRTSETFYSEEYRAFLDRFGHEAQPFWITEAMIDDTTRPRPGQSDDERAQIALTGSVTSFLNGVEVILIAGAAYADPKNSEKVQEAWEVVVSTIDLFQTVTPITETSARFEMPDGMTVYAIWDGAGLPADVTGSVLTRRYDGVEANLDASQVTSEMPMFVLVG